jgi:uncharacterized protein YjeT (DUF2065 family)
LTSDTVWLALALVLVIEGLFPFLSPSGWRKMFQQILQLSNGQVRFFGLFSMLVGAALVLFLS